MLIKRKYILLAALMTCGVAIAQGPPGLQIRTTRPDATATIERTLGANKVLVSVLDGKKGPVSGLTSADFAVTRSGEAGKIVSVEPFEETVDVPRHVVLVVDNSYSLEERKVIKKELEELGAVTKALRPIDDVQMVVLRDQKTMKLGGRVLHVETLKSNKVAELDQFAAAACSRKNVTDNTYLYEALFAGLEILRGTPADGPRILWVFSDGEELNSAFKGDVVTQATQGIEGLRVFAVDCMPGPKVDDFLSKLAAQTGGQAKKAGAAADLRTQFQRAATKTIQRYAVGYDFPPPAPVVTAPPTPPPSKTMVFASAALFGFNKADLKPEARNKMKEYREQVRAEMSRADRIKVTGHTDNIGSAAYNKKLSLRRAEAVRDYLVSLGVDPGKLVVSGEGMEKPIADNGTADGRAKNRRVEVEVVGLAK